jgi:predicted transcriptional regulator
MTQTFSENGPIVKALTVVKAVKAGANTVGDVMQTTGFKRSTVNVYLLAGYETGLLNRKQPKRDTRCGSESFVYWMP